MAVIIITSCDTEISYEVNLFGPTLTLGEVRHFTLTGSTPDGCYTYDGPGTTPVDTIAGSTPY